MAMIDWLLGAMPRPHRDMGTAAEVALRRQKFIDSMSQP